MRTNITTTANGKTHLHLKANYQYNLRGTKYTIPDAKPGRSKGQIKGGTGLILREDQREWQDAVRMEEGRKRKEERKKTWDDPDVSFDWAMIRVWGGVWGWVWGWGVYGQRWGCEEVCDGRLVTVWCGETWFDDEGRTRAITTTSRRPASLISPHLRNADNTTVVT